MRNTRRWYPLDQFSAYGESLGEPLLRGQTKGVRGCDGPRPRYSSTSRPMTQYPMPAARSPATSAFISARGLIHPLTSSRPIMPTSRGYRRSWQPGASSGSTYREQNAVHPTEPALSDVPTFHVRAQLILSMTQQHWLPPSVYSLRYHERRNYTDRA